MRKAVELPLVRVGMLALVAILLSACLVGSDDDDGDDPVGSPEPTVEATTAASPSATATVTESASPTDTSVPATATNTPSPTATATATPIPKEPIGAIAPLDPFTIPNFTLTTETQLRGVPGQAEFTMSLLILQAAPDHYYLRSTTGNSGIESWLVDGTAYLTQADGSVARLPDGSDTALFSPALLVQTVPAINGETLATRMGTSELGGRPARNYLIDAEDLLGTTNWLPGEDARDAEGQINLWIDEELGIILLQESDVRWTNADGTEGSFLGRYEVSSLTTTEPVTAPGS